jgi:hypothetical protein
MAMAVVLAVSGCTGAGRSPRAAAPTPAPASAPPASVAPDASRSAPPGCGQTPVRVGGLPAWTASAGPPASLSYVVSAEGNLVGVLFGAPLQAPAATTGRNNKILWIVREARGGQPLTLTAQRVDGPGAEVATTEEADSSPGEIYPSIVDVPAPGCWHVTARWNGNTATVDLLYGPPS